jgi:microsomal dipeptidase-like Zn-dependent dipeptidase
MDQTGVDSLRPRSVLRTAQAIIAAALLICTTVAPSLAQGKGVPAPVQPVQPVQPVPQPNQLPPNPVPRPFPGVRDPILNSEQTRRALQQALTLYGFADLHAHPASFLSFGGQDDGQRGMMWGRPAVGSTRSFSSLPRYPVCPHPNHAPGFDEDPVRRLIRGLVISSTDGRTRYPHGPNRPDALENWPSSLILSHQQIDIAWLRRAYHGGLRLMVAATVDNEVITRLNRDWDIGKTYEAARAFLQGRDLRPFLGMPTPGFGFESSRRQIAFIRQMVSENSDWMEIATSAAEARRIVGAGRLAIVLGVEMDTVTPDEMMRLIREDGVRVITPIHFVDNAFGGAAAYSALFSVLTGLIGAPTPETGVPGPYLLRDDETIDFRITPLMEELTAQLDELTASALRWRPIATLCAADATSSVRRGGLGCPGQRNARGLSNPRAIENMIRAGAMIDLAHMSQNSMTGTLEIAERLNCPVLNTHSGVRASTFTADASERSIREEELRRMFNLGGVLGLGTGPGHAWDEPQRFYYNAGNPLIELAGARTAWTLDLRQREVRSSIDDAPFSEYRVTLRIGNDNVEGGNRLTAALLNRRGNPVATCALNPGDAGVAGGAVLGPVTCRTDRPLQLLDVQGMSISHTGGCSRPFCTGDNVNIDEVRVEANVGAPRNWLTVLQRTGGTEGEVVRLKGSILMTASEAANVLNPQTWVTHILPTAAEFGSVGSLRVATFTNEDDLGSSAPAAVKVELSGHRRSISRELGAGTGMPLGTLTEDAINFPSRRETHTTLQSVTLSVGRPDTGLVDAFVAARRAAVSGVISPAHIDFALGLLGGVAVSSVPIVVADPVSAGLGVLLSGLMSDAGIDVFRDNWSTRLAVWAGRTPLLVGYTPTQRLTGQQPTSQIFRGLPRGIDGGTPYGGIVIDYMLKDDLADGRSLVFEVLLSDGRTVYSRAAAPGAPIKGGKEWRTFVPFGQTTRGAQLLSLTVRSVGGPIRLRSLDLGIIRDPASDWALEYRRLAGIAPQPGQIALGTDLSGFEALIPFTSQNVGYPIDTATIAGRADPARSRAGVPASLNVEVLAGGRQLNIKTEGIATVGQLPDFVFAAAESLDRERGVVGPELFTSVDAFVRMWERLDTVRGADRCSAG